MCRTHPGVGSCSFHDSLSSRGTINLSFMDDVSSSFREASSTGVVVGSTIANVITEGVPDASDGIASTTGATCSKMLEQHEACVGTVRFINRLVFVPIELVPTHLIEGCENEDDEIFVRRQLFAIRSVDKPRCLILKRNAKASSMKSLGK